MNFSRKEPGGGQRGILGRVKIRFIALKIRAMSQYGGGMGGGFVDKKRFRQTPLPTFVLLRFEFVFFLNNVKYCNIQYIYIKTVNLCMNFRCGPDGIIKFFSIQSIQFKFHIISFA